MNLRVFAHPMTKVHFYIGVLAMLGCQGAAHAQAPLLGAVISLQPLEASILMASVNSVCVTIAYDKNGNRVSQTVGNVTTSPTIWGSGTYGCFVWKP